MHTAAVDPYDPEDLAVAADGTVWLADTGDNRRTRATVALIALRPTAPTGIYRLTYPDGPHDAEALLLAPDGTPYVVTKEILGASGVYRPAAHWSTAGRWRWQGRRRSTLHVHRHRRAARSGRPASCWSPGERSPATAAPSPCARYTDAYVWPLSGSDVAGRAGRDAACGSPLPAVPAGRGDHLHARTTAASSSPARSCPAHSPSCRSRPRPWRRCPRPGRRRRA